MLIIPVNHEALRLPPHRLDCVSFFVAPHGPLSSLFQPLGVPSWTPFPSFGGFLSGLLQPLSGPSPFFVALHGLLSSLFQPLGVPSWTPFPSFGGFLSGLLQPLSGPSPFFVAPHGPLSSLFQPLGVPSWTPCPTFGGFLSGLLQPLSGPSPFFVALRGYLFAFSWKFFLRLAIPGLSSLSNPLVALRRSSWPLTDPFRVFSIPLESLCGPPFRALADSSRVSSNPLVALRRSSWPLVDIFLPFRGNSFSAWRSLAGPS